MLTLYQPDDVAIDVIQIPGSHFRKVSIDQVKDIDNIHQYIASKDCGHFPPAMSPLY